MPRVAEIVCCLFILVMNFGCSGNTWPKAERTKFIDECKTEGGSSSYCNCYLDNVMLKYPNASDAEQLDFETAVELSKDCE